MPFFTGCLKILTQKVDLLRKLTDFDNFQWKSDLKPKVCRFESRHLQVCNLLISVKNIFDIRVDINFSQKFKCDLTNIFLASKF